MKKIVFTLAFLSSQAFAFGAYTGKLVCVSQKSAKVRVSAVLPFMNSEGDGFAFDEGGVVNINGASEKATLVSRNNEETMSIGPSMFTFQNEEKDKLGFIIRTKDAKGKRLPLIQVDPSTDVAVEVIRANGQSLGVEGINCDVLIDQ